MNRSRALITLGLLATSLLPLRAAEPDGDAILRQMSTKLAAAQSFRFEATREIAPELLLGPILPEKASISVAVHRPNQLAAVSKGKSGVRRFITDGVNVTLVDEKLNVYAKIPMRKSIDGVVDELDEKFGFVPPLADFAVSNPYREFRRQASTVTYLGLAKPTNCFFGFCASECHRILLKGKAADAELWIGVKDQLPRKLTVTFHQQGEPQLRITFSRWNLNAPVSASEFVYNPPKGAQQIEMWSNARMQSAR